MAGDPAAWTEFFETYGLHVIRWCRQHGLQKADAQDVSQDVLLRLWRHAANFEYDPALKFRRYLRAVVSSALSEWYQDYQSREVAPGGTANVNRLLELPVREALIARLERAYDMELLELAKGEVRQRVLPRTWQAFELLAVDRRPGTEVAQLLEMNIATVYTARLNVQRMIQDVVSRLENEDAVASPLKTQ